MEGKSSKQDKYKTLIEQTRATRFKPGQSGNPGGRPKDPGITSVQMDMLDTPCPYGKDPKVTWREWLAEKGLIQAGERDSALEHLKDRLEGKVTAVIDLGSGEGRAINISFIEVKEGGSNGQDSKGKDEALPRETA